jgi:hypothetical protein
MAETIELAGEIYRDSYMWDSPEAAPIRVMYVGLERGGDTVHKGHEAGLQADFRLPRTDGVNEGGLWTNNPPYDRNATRAMLEAFWECPLVDKILFNDPDLIAEELCESEPDHDNHFHVSLSPPEME